MTDARVGLLATSEVLDVEGHAHKLGDHFESRPAALLFVRHFGWLFCREEVARSRDVLPEIRARGGELVVVGSGTPAQAKRFADEERFGGVMVTDPTLEAYNRAGMQRSVLRTLNPKSMVSAVRALGSGHRQRKNAGDPWQQGGVIVVSALNRGGREVLFHAASTAGDPTDFRAIVTAFDELARSA